MDLSDLTIIKEFVSPKDIVTVTVLWFMMKNKVAEHFKSIETSLENISRNLRSLKESLESVETSHAQKISDLSMRVQKLEKK